MPAVVRKLCPCLAFQFVADEPPWHCLHLVACLCLVPPARQVRCRGHSDGYFLREALDYIAKTWPWWNKLQGARHFLIHTGEGHAVVGMPGCVICSSVRTGALQRSVFVAQRLLGVMAQSAFVTEYLCSICCAAHAVQATWVCRRTRLTCGRGWPTAPG